MSPTKRRTTQRSAYNMYEHKKHKHYSNEMRGLRTGKNSNNNHHHPKNTLHGGACLMNITVHQMTNHHRLRCSPCHRQLFICFPNITRQNVLVINIFYNSLPSAATSMNHKKNGHKSARDVRPYSNREEVMMSPMDRSGWAVEQSVWRMLKAFRFVIENMFNKYHWARPNVIAGGERWWGDGNSLSSCSSVQLRSDTMCVLTMMMMRISDMVPTLQLVKISFIVRQTPKGRQISLQIPRCLVLCLSNRFVLTFTKTSHHIIRRY